MGCGSSTHKQVVPIWRIRWSWGMMVAYWTNPQNIQNPCGFKNNHFTKTMWENHWFKETMFPKKLVRTFWFRQLPAPSFPTAGAPTKPVAWGQVKIKQPVTSGDDPDLPHEDFADPKNLRKIWQNQTWRGFRLFGQFSGFCWIVLINFSKFLLSKFIWSHSRFHSTFTLWDHQKPGFSEFLQRMWLFPWIFPLFSAPCSSTIQRRQCQTMPCGGRPRLRQAPGAFWRKFGILPEKVGI